MYLFGMLKVLNIKFKLHKAFFSNVAAIYRTFDQSKIFLYRGIGNSVHPRLLPQLEKNT